MKLLLLALLATMIGGIESVRWRQLQEIRYEAAVDYSSVVWLGKYTMVSDCYINGPVIVDGGTLLANQVGRLIVPAGKWGAIQGSGNLFKEISEK